MVFVHFENILRVFGMVCAVYPSRNGQPNECKPGHGGRMNTRDNDVNVSFVVRVPAIVTSHSRGCAPVYSPPCTSDHLTFL